MSGFSRLQLRGLIMTITKNYFSVLYCYLYVVLSHVMAYADHNGCNMVNNSRIWGYKKLSGVPL